jgi:hypothetical protein
VWQITQNAKASCPTALTPLSRAGMNQTTLLAVLPVYPTDPDR